MHRTRAEQTTVGRQLFALGLHLCSAADISVGLLVIFVRPLGWFAVYMAKAVAIALHNVGH